MQSRHPCIRTAASNPLETLFSEPPCSAHRIAALAAIQGTLAVSTARLPNLRNLGVVPDAGISKAKKRPKFNPKLTRSVS
jgi:hypothetical protein